MIQTKIKLLSGGKWSTNVLIKWEPKKAKLLKWHLNPWERNLWHTFSKNWNGDPVLPLIPALSRASPPQRDTVQTSLCSMWERLRAKWVDEDVAVMDMTMMVCNWWREVDVTYAKGELQTGSLYFTGVLYVNVYERTWTVENVHNQWNCPSFKPLLFEENIS